MSTAIRRDVFSVKVGNCHAFMTKDRDEAIKRLRRERQEQAAMRLGFMPKTCKLVHPAQWVVDGYVLANGQLGHTA